MKNMPKIITAVTALSCLTACGESGILGNQNNNPAPDIPEAPVEDFKYAYDAETLGIMITKYIGIPVKVRIPDKIEGEPVTKIGEVAFGLKGIISVHIPNTVTAIGNRAFSGCTGLTSISIPDSVTEIGWCAFEFCSALTSIVIPNSVTLIDGRLFYSCASLTSIVIPDRVTNVGDYAFVSCTGLTNITIPNSVTSIGWCAFNKCDNLPYETKQKIFAINPRAFG